MSAIGPGETDEQFAARLADDLARILGAGIMIEELDLGDSEASPARIRAVCLFDARSEVLEAEGATRVEAYNRLISAAAELRLAVTKGNMIAPI